MQGRGQAPTGARDSLTVRAECVMYKWQVALPEQTAGRCCIHSSACLPPADSQVWSE